jgi:hypothetical protein
VAKPTDILVRLPAQSVTATLSYLADLSQRQRRGEREVHVPRATLLLRSGHSFEGMVLGYTPTGGWVVCAGVTQTSDLDTLYVAAADVLAVRVHHTPQTLQQTADLKLSPAAAPSGVIEANLPHNATTQIGNLALKRLPAELTQGWQNDLGLDLPIQAVWESLPTSDLARSRWHGFLNDLDGCIRQLYDDPLGRVSLKEKVTAIRLTTGTAPEVRLSGGVLALYVTSVGEDLLALNRTDLLKAMERVL